MSYSDLIPRTTDARTGWAIITFDFFDTAVVARVGTFRGLLRNTRCHSGLDIRRVGSENWRIKGRIELAMGGDRCRAQTGRAVERASKNGSRRNVETQGMPCLMKDQQVPHPRTPRFRSLETPNHVAETRLALEIYYMAAAFHSTGVA